MKQIPLSRGMYALVDDEDYEFLSQWKWCVVEPQKKRFYAIRRLYLAKKKYTFLKMHRAILGITNKTVLVDHLDSNGLNNQKINLRSCDSTGNSRNAKKRSGLKTSKYKGVSVKKTANDVLKYRAGICADRKQYRLGVFDTEIEAAVAYDKKAKELHGEFAVLNFP